MKLRNKNTGEIIDLDIANIKAQFGAISVIPEPVKLGGDEYVYHSLAELNAEWEDYVPKEPLIKDEKVRKAVRAWAEANEYDKLWVYHDNDAISFYNEDDDDNEIIFNTVKKFGLRHLKCYTIAELCGEEEI